MERKVEEKVRKKRRITMHLRQLSFHTLINSGDMRTTFSITRRKRQERMRKGKGEDKLGETENWTEDI